MKNFLIFLLCIFLCSPSYAAVCLGVDDTALFNSATLAGSLVKPLPGETCIVGKITGVPAAGFGVHCQYGSGSTIKLKNGTNDDLFYVNGIGSGYLFNGCIADGNKANNTGNGEIGNFIQTAGGSGAYAKNVIIRDWTFKNWAGNGLRLTSSRDWYLENVTWENTGTGPYFSAPANFPSFRMRAINAKILGTHIGDGFGIDNSCDDCEVDAYVENPQGDCGIVFDNTNRGNGRFRVKMTGVNCGNNGLSIHGSYKGEVDVNIQGTCAKNTLCNPTTDGWGHCIDISNNESNQKPIHDIIVRGQVDGCAKNGVRIRNNQVGLIENVNLDLIIGSVGNGYKKVKFEDSNSRNIRLNNKLMFGHLYYSVGTGLVDGGADNFNSAILTRLSAGKYKITAFNYLTNDENKLKALCTAFDINGGLTCGIIDRNTTYVTLGITNASGVFVDAARVYFEVF